jgi:hypothetical protein
MGTNDERIAAVMAELFILLRQIRRVGGEKW